MEPETWKNFTHIIMVTSDDLQRKISYLNRFFRFQVKIRENSPWEFRFWLEIFSWDSKFQENTPWETVYWLCIPWYHLFSIYQISLRFQGTFLILAMCGQGVRMVWPRCLYILFLHLNFPIGVACLFNNSQTKNYPCINVIDEY